MAQMKAFNFLDPHQNTYWLNFKSIFFGQIGQKSDAAQKPFAATRQHEKSQWIWMNILVKKQQKWDEQTLNEIREIIINKSELHMMV